MEVFYVWFPFLACQITCCEVPPLSIHRFTVSPVLVQYCVVSAIRSFSTTRSFLYTRARLAIHRKLCSVNNRPFSPIATSLHSVLANIFKCFALLDLGSNFCIHLPMSEWSMLSSDSNLVDCIFLVHFSGTD
jgi:hypothetical protein